MGRSLRARRERLSLERLVREYRLTEMDECGREWD